MISEFFCQATVLPGVEDQWIAVAGMGKLFDPADEEGVVAAEVGGFVGNHEMRTAIGEDGGASRCGRPFQAGKAVDGPGGEAGGQVFLLTCEDVDRVVAGGLKGGQIVRTVVQAPEDERRGQRDGGEGIHRQANRLAVRVDGGDHRNPGRELSQRLTQGAAVNFGRGRRRGRGLAHGWCGVRTKSRVLSPFVFL